MFLFSFFFLFVALSPSGLFDQNALLCGFVSTKRKFFCLFRFFVLCSDGFLLRNGRVNLINDRTNIQSNNNAELLSLYTNQIRYGFCSIFSCFSSSPNIYNCVVCDCAWRLYRIAIFIFLFCLFFSSLSSHCFSYNERKNFFFLVLVFLMWCVRIFHDSQNTF